VIINKFGGDMQRIKSVGVLSSAKIFGIIYGCIGLVMATVALASFAFRKNSGVLGGIEGVAIAIMAPILYSLMGFAVGAITALIYNLAATWIGGIEIQLESDGAMAGNQIGVIWPSPDPE